MLFIAIVQLPGKLAPLKILFILVKLDISIYFKELHPENR